MGFGSDFNDLREAVDHFADALSEEAPAADLWQLQQLGEFETLVMHADGLHAEHLDAADGTFAGESRILAFATAVVVDAQELVKLMKKATDSDTGAVGGEAWKDADKAAGALASKLKGGQDLISGPDVKLMSDLDAVDGLSGRNLKASDDGSSLDFWQDGPLLFIGEGFPAFVRERGKGGTIVLKKASWINDGTVRVTGGGDASDFKTALRRFSKKAIVR